MRVLVLGGCGAQGTFATKELVTSDEISEVVIGDYNIEKAKKLASELESDKIDVAKVDVRKEDELVDLMKKYDIVVNCVGPFYMYGEGVLRASIRAERDYVDICDDPDATVKMLSMDDEAREAGITAVVGMGASPGITNVLSVYFARKLDRVDEIRQYWVVDSSSDPEGMAVMYHAAHGLTGKVPQFIDGKLVEVPAGSGAEVVKLLSGDVEVVYFGHPEPITLPRYIDGVKTVINKGGFLPALDFKIFRLMSRLGLFSTKSIAGISPRRLTVSILTKIATQHELKKETRTAMRVEVRGEKGGEETIYAADLRGHMGPATGLPAAIVAIMLTRGEIESKGVLPPEACVDPELFLKRAAERIPPGSTLIQERIHRGPLIRLVQ
jgi:saccharopine dehydrogenase (NAD+, L-lysine-forming)